MIHLKKDKHSNRINLISIKHKYQDILKNQFTPVQDYK